MPARILSDDRAAARMQPDVTLVAYGGMLPVVERAAAALEAEEFAVEIVSPSLLQPLPRQTLLRALAQPSARRDRRGVAGLARVSDPSSRRRLLSRGSPDASCASWPPPVPIPAARSLEAQVLSTNAGCSRRWCRSSSRLMPTPLHTPRVNNNDDPCGS